ncbi:protease modulator HflC [Dasania sp. GY-MA-18]|uniref:Protein HflC n=1 Tax=Dasania phycosphaerae TaxID=2950436 RepID=A0A9J6RM63_9GAMM|nr:MULTISPECIES: protease modulator HflC [Dasania]MCR8923124.1 protease modulator HflC [Dasania sp. GY-MA-18]MCZ0865556.1 protease modulator HflC [Dasania phycosphaerae]MCZ0869281.1 protease modulator HflC [Dasania phycosphaerae]
MSNRSIVVLAIIGLVLIVLSNTLYIIKETERAVLLEFGRLVESDIKPGLHIKKPLINEVRKFDARILTVDAAPEEFLNAEKKGMSVDSFVKWRIIDVGKYYTATNGEEVRAARLIAQRANEGLRNQFGKRTLHEVVSGERDQLMHELVDTLNKLTQGELGVEIIDVRVKRIDLPDRVSGAVFDRMRTGREREAREHRSKGIEQAEVIRADADRKRTVIEAEAYRDSEKIRGEGDAKATAIYSSAYNRDPEFYSFVRSLTAYKAAFKDKGDMMIVDPESDFFKYLKSSTAK